MKGSPPRFLGGTARRNISPQESIWLGGFGMRTKPSTGILADIYARVLALQDSTGQLSVVVSVDQIGLSAASIQEILAELTNRYGLKRERIVIACSHSHSTPVCDRGLQLVYPMTDEQWEAVDRYAVFLRKNICEGVGQALAAMEPVHLSFGQGVAGFGVNRRRVRPGCRHFPGPVDHDVPVLQMSNAAGKIRALVFGYACHTTSLADYEVNGDFAGFAAQELEDLYPDATCLFMAGCGADINPLPRNRIDLTKCYGHILAAAVQEVVSSGEGVALTEAIQAGMTEVWLPLEPLKSVAELSWIASDGPPHLRRWAALLRDDALPGSTQGRTYPIQAWSFGPALTWIILTSEACVDYALRFKAAYGWETTWVSAYANELLGYIPSRRVHQEGGYEGGDSAALFGLAAAFTPELEEKIAEAVDHLIGQIQR